MVRRGFKIVLMQLAKMGGVFGFTARQHKRSIPILCYHGAWGLDDGFKGDAMFMRAETFAGRMELIKRLGLKVISLDEAVAALKGDVRVAEGSVVITIDDGWYSTYQYMMPVLLEYGFPATLYCDTAQLRRGGVVPHVMASYVRRLSGLSSFSSQAEQYYDLATAYYVSGKERLDNAERFAQAIGFDLQPYMAQRSFEYMNEEELRLFANSGLDVQLHTHNHTMGDLSVDVVLREVRANAAALADILGRDVSSFKHLCYPSGVTNQALADELLGGGIESATTTVMNIAQPEMHVCLLPRIIDNGNLTEIEIEAEIAGFMASVRRPF